MTDVAHEDHGLPMSPLARHVANRAEERLIGLGLLEFVDEVYIKAVGIMVARWSDFRCVVAALPAEQRTPELLEAVEDCRLMARRTAATALLIDPARERIGEVDETGADIDLLKLLE